MKNLALTIAGKTVKNFRIIGANSAEYSAFSLATARSLAKKLSEAFMREETIYLFRDEQIYSGFDAYKVAKRYIIENVFEPEHNRKSVSNAFII